MTASDDSSDTGQAEVALTLVLPLRARESMSLDDFYDYWLNAHVTLPARTPGIYSIWLHAVSAERSLWPQQDGVSSRADAGDEIHGIPEATFPTLEDLNSFQVHSQLQMDDGENFLAEQIAYRSVGSNSVTLVDRSNEPAPDGHDPWVRHFVFLRRREGVSVEQFRRFVTDSLMPSYGSSSDVLKLRQHLFEEVEVTLDHPGVAMSKPLARQYQAAFEIVVADESGFDNFVRSTAFSDVAQELAEHCQAVHGLRVERCITTKYRGRITIAGVRGAATADAIKRLNAKNQMSPALSNLFLPEPLPLYS